MWKISVLISRKHIHIAKKKTDTDTRRTHHTACTGTGHTAHELCKCWYSSKAANRLCFVVCEHDRIQFEFRFAMHQQSTRQQLIILTHDVDNSTKCSRCFRCFSICVLLFSCFPIASNVTVLCKGNFYFYFSGIRSSSSSFFSQRFT